MDFRPYLNIAEKAALAAGRLILQNTHRLDRLKVYTKNPNDFVSEVDLMSDNIIIEEIQNAYPQHAILSEEQGLSGPEDAAYCWVIDPLDGTTNFLHGFPFFAVSIALLYKKKPVVGVIFDPSHNELFCAMDGQGATLNQRKIRVSDKKELATALIGTGIPYKHNQSIDDYLAVLHTLISGTSSIRRAGAASLDLAYVAAGRFDGFWEFGLNIWDIAAGAVIVQEAGGLIGDLSGGFDHLDSGDTLAANSALFKKMLEIIRPDLGSADKE